MHNCLKRNLTIGLLICGVFLAAFTVSRPALAASAETPATCELKAVDCKEGYKPNLTTCECEDKSVTECADGEELNSDGECVEADEKECADDEELNDDGECVETTTSCGNDESWDALEEKCVALSTTDESDDSEDDSSGGGCSFFKKKADGTYGCSLATASASGGGMYIYLLMLGYFVTARLRKK
jgi:hypothetical protein